MSAPAAAAAGACGAAGAAATAGGAGAARGGAGTGTGGVTTGRATTGRAGTGAAGTGGAATGGATTGGATGRWSDDRWNRGRWSDGRWRGRGDHGRRDGRDVEADLECRSVGRRLLHPEHRLGRRHHHGLALLLLDETCEPRVDVAPARVDLLDLLEDRHRLRRESLGRVLVGEREQQRHRLLPLVGEKQHVGELHAQARVRAAPLQLRLQDLDGAGELLRGDERDDVLFLRLP